MSHKILFSEQQFFRQWWIKLIFVLMYLPLFFITNQEELSFSSSLILYSFIIVSTLWFFRLNLKTFISQNDILVVFDFIIYKHKKTFNINDIQSLHIITYNPIMDCGGWGIKWWKNVRTYNVMGNIGLEIVLKNNKKYLIGTQEPKKLEKIIQKFQSDEKVAVSVS